jgi:hypothetical protein
MEFYYADSEIFMSGWNTLYVIAMTACRIYFVKMSSEQCLPQLSHNGHAACFSQPGSLRFVSTAGISTSSIYCSKMLGWQMEMAKSRR